MIEDLNSGEKNEIYFNKKWFDRYYPLSKFDKYHGNLYWRYVLLNNGSLSKGRLLVRTVEKNE
jgi:hypothetical protein